MSAGFTPGPWSFDGEPHNMIVWSSPEDRVCFLTSNGPTEANARLIAAAPELYERVESSRVALEEAAQILDGHGLPGCASIMRGYIAGNDAALAKVRGDQ